MRFSYQFFFFGTLVLLSLATEWREEMLSVMGGFFAVALPPVLLFCVAQTSPQRAFSWWMSKFSVTVLLLAVAVRLLHIMGALESAFLLVGAMLALPINIYLAARVVTARAN